MAEAGEEQNKSEQATPFKLDRARKRGVVARGMDLGFLAMLAGLAGVSQLFGAGFMADAADMMRQSFAAGIAAAAQPAAMGPLAARAGLAMLWPVAITGLFIAALVALGEVIQLRGVVFSATPLKPDFSRLNPAKGIKRLFSMRMLKETGKSILKMAVYLAATWLLVRDILADDGARATDGSRLASVMAEAAGSLLMLYIALALLFAAIDQLIVRREFGKQMRMSRRELVRENRDREGEPRQKQRRKQLHADYVKQSAAVAQVAGADVLVVNPQHYAVALVYRPAEMDAPAVRALGRNAFALRMRLEASRRGVIVVESPALARALHRGGKVGAAIHPDHYAAVADIYTRMRRDAASRSGARC